ncbi:hypothetical protein KY289_008317 [Solanum tuberosum]|nr:hypothetical protein KY289_008317 [Solanum tuberosum]
MATRSETRPPKGKVTLESIMGALTNVNRTMENIKGHLTTMKGSMSRIDEIINKVEGRVNYTNSTPKATFRVSTSGHDHTISPTITPKIMIDWQEGLSMMEYGSNTVEDESWPKEGEFALPTYVVRRTMTSKSKSNQSQRENIFHSKCLIQGNVCSLIIDSGSWANVASTAPVDFLRLPTTKLTKPCELQWLNECEELRVDRQVLIKFRIGKYQDAVICDVIPMQACHVLLERPWQHVRSKKHDGRINTNSLVSNGHKYVLHPISLSQVMEMYQKMDELRNKRKKEEGHIEIEGQKEEERRKLKRKITNTVS